MIVQNISEAGAVTNITFTVPENELDKTMNALKIDDLKGAQIRTDANITKISVVGIGMRSHAGVAQTMFRTLANKGINIQVISTSEIKISVIVAKEYLELAVRSLHSAYGLDQE